MFSGRVINCSEIYRSTVILSKAGRSGGESQAHGSLRQSVAAIMKLNPGHSCLSIDEPGRIADCSESEFNRLGFIEITSAENIFGTQFKLFVASEHLHYVAKIANAACNRHTKAA